MRRQGGLAELSTARPRHPSRGLKTTCGPLRLQNTDIRKKPNKPHSERCLGATIIYTAGLWIGTGGKWRWAAKRCWSGSRQAEGVASLTEASGTVGDAAEGRRGVGRAAGRAGRVTGQACQRPKYVGMDGGEGQGRFLQHLEHTESVWGFFFFLFFF